MITTMKTTLASLGALAVATSLSFAQEPSPEAPTSSRRKPPSPDLIFKKLDTNRDGFLSLDEFKASTFGMQNPALAEENYQKMDVKADGKVTLEEFKTFRPAWNPEEMFKKLDTNADGFLSFDEFKDSPMAQGNPAKAEIIYKKLDANSDGKVTLEEFKAFRPRTRGGNDAAPAPLKSSVK